MFWYFNTRLDSLLRNCERYWKIMWILEWIFSSSNLSTKMEYESKIKHNLQFLKFDSDLSFEWSYHVCDLKQPINASTLMDRTTEWRIPCLKLPQKVVQYVLCKELRYDHIQAIGFKSRMWGSCSFPLFSTPLLSHSKFSHPSGTLCSPYKPSYSSHM